MSFQKKGQASDIWKLILARLVQPSEFMTALSFRCHLAAIYQIMVAKFCRQSFFSLKERGKEKIFKLITRIGLL